MPTYDYLCEGCGTRWEALLPIADRELPCELPCPECGEKRVARAYITPPVGGADATLSPGADFKNLMRRMSHGQPQRVREGLDRAASLRGRKYRTQ
jgi:putative FmdB family regulatory protein